MAADLLPFQCSFFPNVYVADEENDDEDTHLSKNEWTEAGGDELLEDNRPRIKEHRLDVKQDEEHRNDVELDREPLACTSDRLAPTLVRSKFYFGRLFRSDKGRKNKRAKAEQDFNRYQDDYGQISTKHLFPPI